MTYRGVLLDSLERVFGVGALSVLIQAIVFGLLHIQGFPRGWIGVFLAFDYGLFMGVFRMKSHGLLAPWIAHVVTDTTIVFILVFQIDR